MIKYVNPAHRSMMALHNLAQPTPFEGNLKGGGAAGVLQLLFIFGPCILGRISRA